MFERDFTDDLFDSVFSLPFAYENSSKGKMKMKSDLKEFDDKYELSLQLPGFEKEDIKAELKNGYLTVSATHAETQDKSEKSGAYVWKESFSGQFVRSFYVGKDVKQEEIKASFVNGELKLSVPKVEEKPEIQDSKYIAIEG
jgi:HSP20 family molecular chaperone IbpA